MNIQHGKHVTITCDLEIGQEVFVEGYGVKYGRPLDGKRLKIEKIIPAFGGCQSGFLVKLDGYENPIDSDWVTKA